MAISPVRIPGVVDPRQVYGGAGAQPATGPSFATKLQEAIQTVDRAQDFRDEMIEGAVSGRVGEVHDVMIAAEEAQLAFELMLEIRNKLLESYNQIMQMQL
ncbi:flagellar hook-basal body complex protein FliE [bacterium]|nr:flagellar hook-basal body complex protein FliE [bacterium]MBU1072952.1 flagellar hook-basal body complex protein FliE [bacterium]MBU1674565.1 flagellar hook-basal body complex protein FliE [bacterium]